jgi:multidrug efflux system membrane fusion protein
MTPRLRRAGRVVLVCALLGVACSRGGEQPPSGGPQPVPVAVAVAARKSVPLQIRAIGNVLPSETVTVRSRVGGILAKVHFREGQDVTENQVLMTLETGPLEAALRQAQAQLARSRAQLQNAQRDAARYAELARQGFVAQQEYDRLRTAADALVATVQADQAVVENARLQLSYATIRAPMSGRSGALLVHEGDLIKANDTALVVINRLRPVDVAFALPERELPEVRRYRDQGSLAVEVLTPQGGPPLGRGELTFIDNRVDPTTGTIQLKATFANADRTLWPGQYVNVVLTLAVEPAATVVPTAAVQQGQQGSYVFVVKPDETVEWRKIRVARQVGSESVIAEGVAPGETVVTDGQLRLAPGVRVEARAAPAMEGDHASAEPPTAGGGPPGAGGAAPGDSAAGPGSGRPTAPAAGTAPGASAPAPGAPTDSTAGAGALPPAPAAPGSAPAPPPPTAGANSGASAPAPGRAPSVATTPPAPGVPGAGTGGR